MRRALILLSCLTAWATPAAADTPIDLASCLGIQKLLPAAITDLEVVLCTAPDAPQIRAELTYMVPAEAVRSIADLIETDYAMAPLRYVCCSYETAQPGEIPIPDGHFPRSVQQQLTGDYDAIQTVLHISMTARALPVGTGPDVTDGDPTPTNLLPLGELPGLLILTLSDI